MPGTQRQDATQSTRERNTQSPARNRHARVGLGVQCSRHAVSTHILGTQTETRVFGTRVLGKQDA
eukprot:12508129-Alexandrium_andersonii.AAC.1